MDIIVKSPYADIDIPEVTVTEFILKKCMEYGENTALICSTTDKKITYLELIDIIKRLATGLNKLGLKQRDVLCAFLPNCLEYLPLCLATISLGSIFTTSNPNFTEDELVPYFNTCKVNYIVTMDITCEKILSLKHRCPSLKAIINIGSSRASTVDFNSLTTANNFKEINFPKISPKEDSALYLASSGTTGLPKVAVLSHYNIVSHLLQTSNYKAVSGEYESFNLKQTESLLSVFPYFHVVGLVYTGFLQMKNGATSIIMSKYSEPQFFQCIEKYRPYSLGVSPPLFITLTKSPLAESTDTSSVKVIICGGAPANVDLMKLTCTKLNMKYIIQGYGMTEFTGVTSFIPIGDISAHKFGSCGVLFPNTLCKISDIERTKTLGPNEVGEICIKGPQVMKGYLENGESNKELFDKDGWLMTGTFMVEVHINGIFILTDNSSGDVGYFDNDNFLFLVDRVKELIKVKAYQVAPAELEAILLTHPGIADAAVIGVADEYAGELPYAFIVKRPGYELDENNVKTFLAEKVVRYKRLEGGVKFVESIPKSASGKILRRILRDRMKI